MGARLGQHFLKHPQIAERLVDAVNVQKGETVVEVGPGTGALTKVLLARGHRVHALEKDTALIERLHTTFHTEIATGQLTVVNQDIRSFTPDEKELGQYVVIANIPYYITGEIIRLFLTASHQPRALGLLMQKEVAQRIVARNNKESLLSLSVKAYGTPVFVAKIARGAFSPPPNVESALLLIDAVSRDFFADTQESLFFDVLHAGFASKRKKVLGNLVKVFGESPRTALTQCNIHENARAEDLSLTQWKQLTRALKANGQGLEKR